MLVPYYVPALVHPLVTTPGPEMLTWAYQAVGVIGQDIRPPHVNTQGETHPSSGPPVRPVAHVACLQVFHINMLPYVHEPPPSEYVSTILCEGDIWGGKPSRPGPPDIIQYMFRS